jgi:hypothetical protein
MRTLRTLHLYLGCLFAPLIVYFCLSGAWQLYGWNDLPKETTPTSTERALHELSKPHTHAAAPGRDPEKDHSALFALFALAAALGMAVTAIVGVMLALQFPTRRRTVMACLLGGLLLPAAFLYVTL